MTKNLSMELIKFYRKVRTIFNCNNSGKSNNLSRKKTLKIPLKSLEVNIE